MEKLKSPSLQGGVGVGSKKSNNFERFFGDSTLTFLTFGNTFRLPILPTRRAVFLCLPLIFLCLPLIFLCLPLISLCLPLISLCLPLSKTACRLGKIFLNDTDSIEEQECRMETAFLHIPTQSYIYTFCFTTTLHTPPRNPTQWRVLCRILRPNPTHLPIWLSNFKPELCRVWRKCIYPWKTYRFERWIRAPRARSLFHIFPVFLFEGIMAQVLL